MPDTTIAPAPPKPAEQAAPTPQNPAINGAPKPKMPPSLERTFFHLGRAFNQDGDLVPVAHRPQLTASRQPGKSIVDLLEDIRSEKKTAGNESAKPNEIDQARPPSVPGENTPPSAPAIPSDANKAETSIDKTQEVGSDRAAIEIVKKAPIEDVIRDTVDQAISKAEERFSRPIPPVSTEPVTVEPQADTYEAALGEIEKEELALAKFASEKLPDRYKEYPAKLVEFYKKVDAYVTRSRKDDSDRTFDDADADFQKFIADNKPRYQATDRRKLERMQITEEVSQKVAEQARIETDALKANQHKLEVRPIVEKTVQEFKDELGEKLKTKAEEPEAIQKLRAPIVKAVQDVAVNRMAEYAALDMRATKFDANKPDHVWLLDFIRQQGAYFSQHGGDDRVRIDPTNGRKLAFMPMQELRALQRNNPAKAEHFWTFDVQDMKAMLSYQAELDANVLVKQETERRTTQGWEPIKTPSPKKEDSKKKSDEQQPQPTSSPKATGSISPGAGNPSLPQPRTHFSHVDFHVLGVKPPV